MNFNCDNKKKTRKSYPNHMKLEEVIHAKEHGFAAAAIKFETDELIIRRWKKTKICYKIRLLNFLNIE